MAGMAGNDGGNRVDSRFHGNDKGGSDGVWRGWQGVAGNDGGNRVDSRFHGNDKGGVTGCGGNGGNGGNGGAWRESTRPTPTGERESPAS